MLYSHKGGDNFDAPYRLNMKDFFKCSNYIKPSVCVLINTSDGCTYRSMKEKPHLCPSFVQLKMSIFFGGGGGGG